MLKFQNTPDLVTATRSLCGNNKIETDTTCKRAKVRVKDLETWLKPRLEPHAWKETLGSIFMQLGATKLAKKLEDEYKAEEDHKSRTEKELFGGKDSTHKIDITHDWISRDDFIHGVTEKVREGNTEVHSEKRNYVIFSYVNLPQM